MKFVVGLFLAIAGVLMTLGNLDLVDSWLYLRYWPALLIVIGLFKIADPIARPFGVVAVLFGSLLLAVTTGLLRFSLFDLWPLLLIGIGVTLVLQATGFRTRRSYDGRTIWGVLSNPQVAITDRAFSGVRAVSFLGGSTIDLTGADMQQSPAIVDVFVLMGGIDLRVPDGWDVATEAVPFMGGIEMVTNPRGRGKQVIVRGFVMMGGIDIKAVAGRTA